jgi:transposase
MKQHVLSGDVFIFINRRRNQVKLLCWDKDGLAVYHKRLEKGTFELPAAGTDAVITLTALQLRLILDGIQLQSIKHRRRYRLTG